MTDINWQDKALEKAKTFVKSIDPDLKVEKAVHESNGEPMLRFYSPKHKIDWKMLFAKDDNYLENDFEKIVENVFKDELSKKQ